MKKTLLIIVAALSTSTFAAPEDASAQFFSRHRQRVAGILNTVQNQMNAAAASTYVIPSNLPGPYIIPNPPGPYIIPSNIASSPKTVVAVENHSHQTLTVYIRWNGGTAQLFQILPHQVLVKSMAGYNQQAELVYHEDLTGNNPIPETARLHGSNVSLQRSPVASDVQWVKELHVSQNVVVATD